MKIINKKLKVKAMDNKTLESINEALKIEKDPYTKFAISILKTTGLRIGELLGLTTDCIEQVDNIYTIEWTDSKKLSGLWNGRKIRNMCVTAECVVAIEELIEFTRELREQADISNKHFLYLHSASGLCSNEIK